MTSKEIKELLKTEKGIVQLYSMHKKYFDLVDTWNTRFAEGDLLDEYQLADAMEKLTGCYGKFIIIGNAVDAYKTNQELDYQANAFRDAEKKPNVSQIKEEARASTKELREVRGDFLNYAEASQKGIGTCQSRLKRLTVEKGAKKVDYTGETPVEEQTTEETDVVWEE